MTQKNESPIFDPALHFDPRTLQEGQSRILLVLPPELFETENSGVKLKGDLNVSVGVVSVEYQGVWLDVTYQGIQWLECSRDLEPFENPMEHQFKVFLRWNDHLKGGNLCETEEDYWLYEVNPHADRLSILEVLRQEILLDQPLNPVRNPEDEFGWTDKNLVVETENVDPRWAKLKELRDKNAK